VKHDITNDFHTWGLEWNENEIVFLFDGKIWTRSNTPESMKVPMYLLINLAVGGKWYAEEQTGQGKPTKPWEVEDASMPWKMECDYVRVYQP
jgi:beta-glucanase (GH16 family)